VKYWEIIADNLSKAGFSWGCVSAIDYSMIGPIMPLNSRATTTSDGADTLS
jgi:hypothetical protein